ncbi:MAG: hypothetical protein IPK16_00375 [Anaerolineales bacterium]|nr:hypothetical protein [Anaerolineales bacterium]
MGLVLQIVILVASVALLASIVLSVLRTLVLPRSARDPITAFLFQSLRQLFSLRLHFAKTYAQSDGVMAYYAPVAMLLLVPVWLALTLLAFAGLFWATGVESPYEAFALSGSSLFTLGFKVDDTWLHMALAFMEAGMGMMIVALLIGYLPTMYSAFSTREAAVNQLDVRSGTPPSVAEAILRAHGIGKLDSLTSFWREWEVLFTQIAESHTTLPALVFFRSPNRDRSWVTASGNVLDMAALSDPPRTSAPIRRQTGIRAGYLRCAIADYFDVLYAPDPVPIHTHQHRPHRI